MGVLAHEAAEDEKPAIARLIGARIAIYADVMFTDDMTSALYR
jgi:hypothetical protein